ncbi:hypothetical protein [Micromonospora sp. NPDC005173]|uniref:hypothetical protein n=1 Tax=Micromonospora sp. NPDC005173 TaxID=3157165 RepID=UPI0033BCDA3A
MSEVVIELELGLPHWDPNDPEAVVYVDERRAAAALNPHPDDADRRAVVLVWSGCRWAAHGAPNDEGRRAHRLHSKGLNGILWLGTVRESSTVEGICAGRATSADSLKHYVLPLKETTLEVVAEDLRAVRLAGPTRQALVSVVVGS